MNLSLPFTILIGFSLALVRTTAWVSICPPFNSPTIPRRIRGGFAVAIALAIAPTMGDVAVNLALGPFMLALLTQAFAGLALGFAVLMLYSTIQAAGDLMDLQVGFSMGAVVDPISGVSAAPLARFHQMLAMVILFAINGHVLVVKGFLRSVEAVPDGSIDMTRLAAELTSLLTAFLISAVEIGLPVLTALFTTEVALGLLGKAAPQMNILVLGFAVKAMIALGLMGISFVFLPETLDSLLGRSIRTVGRAFGG